MLTVDTPVPFPVHELTRNLREAMGQINKSETAAPYRRLETQLASLIEDRRYAFMFRDAYSADDTLSELVGSLLRIPVQGKPISIIDLSGVPSEIADVVVSVTARILFDFTLWSDPLVRPPILLACEEAHRYLPAHEGKTFAACTRAISRIAREGRKYGLSLALISQRPSELSPQALSQCGTVFALRLANDHDQAFVETALPDTGHMMMGALSSLPTQEAVVFGEAVSLPMHVRFDSLPPEKRPRSQSARFSEAWQHDEAGVDFREDAIRRWRSRCD
jgi:DNA helicase HerA-like ATPase